MADKPKKPFSETTTGKLWSKLKEFAPDLVKDIIPGKVDDAIIDSLLDNSKKACDEYPDNPEIAKLHQEVLLAENAMRREASNQAHLERMAEIDQATQIAMKSLEDNSSARVREIDHMKQTGGKRDWLMGSIGLVWTFGAVTLVAFLFYMPVPEPNKDILYMIAGSVMTIATQVAIYYFGSSSSSRAKDKILMAKSA